VDQFASSGSARPLRVLIVEDHEYFRRALREMLQSSGIGVVGEAGDAATAVAVAAETTPDVVLMDINLPGPSGIEATREIRRASPATQVLVLTVSTESETITDAMIAGACGYLLKETAGEQILTAIAAAAAGESPLSPRIASALVERVRAGAPPEDLGTQRPSLTSREREVLRLIVEGAENNQIAAELVISPETVKTHVSSILEKLGADNRVQAAVRAVRAGLV
jgi:DNA-binding NarL/FixJ family response regulator